MYRPARWSSLLALMLLPLFGLLAFLQFRWISEATQFETRRLRSALEASGHALADNLETEFQTLDAALAIPPGQSEGWPAYRERVSQFRTHTRLGALPRRLFLVEPLVNRARELDEASGRLVDAPALTQSFCLPGSHLPSDGLLSLPFEGRTTWFRAIPILELDPLPDTIPSRTGTQILVRRAVQRTYLLVELAPDAFFQDLLPSLVKRHYGPLLEDFEVRLLDVNGGLLGSYGASGTGSGTPDASLPIALPVQPERLLGLLSAACSPPGAIPERTRVVAAKAPDTRAPLGLEVRHREGSTEQVMARVRRRNVALSFGILALMAASLGFLLLASRRLSRLVIQERQFIASVSHELKTPLAVVLAAGENLAAGIVTDPANVKRYGETIGAEGQRLRDMIEKILGFSRVEGGHRGTTEERFDPSQVLAEVLCRLSPLAADSGATFQASGTGTGYRIRGRRTDLDSILENLLGNALKHGLPTPGNSQAAPPWLIQVRTGTEQRRSGRYWTCSIQDSGPGIPRRERRRIFAPFTRGARAIEEQTPGSGLGLAIALECARGLGGELHLEPRLGPGACFTLRLPLEAP